MLSSGASLETRVKCVISDLDVTSKQLSEHLQWSKLHVSLSFTELSIIINTTVFWLTWLSNRVSGLTYRWPEFLFLMSSSGASLETRVKCVVSDLDVTSKQLSEHLQWSKLHFSLIHGTIHHHQHSSFLTNMTVKQSFLTKIEMAIEVQSFSFWCHHQGQPWRRGSMKAVSDLDSLSKYPSDRHQWDETSFSLSRNYHHQSQSSFSD